MIVNIVIIIIVCLLSELKLMNQMYLHKKAFLSGCVRCTIMLTEGLGNPSLTVVGSMNDGEMAGKMVHVIDSITI